MLNHAAKPCRGQPPGRVSSESSSRPSSSPMCRGCATRSSAVRRASTTAACSAGHPAAAPLTSANRHKFVSKPPNVCPSHCTVCSSPSRVSSHGACSSNLNCGPAATYSRPDKPGPHQQKNIVLLPNHSKSKSPTYGRNGTPQHTLQLPQDLHGRAARRVGECGQQPSRSRGILHLRARHKLHGGTAPVMRIELRWRRRSLMEYPSVQGIVCRPVCMCRWHGTALHVPQASRSEQSQGRAAV